MVPCESRLCHSEIFTNRNEKKSVSAVALRLDASTYVSHENFFQIFTISFGCIFYHFISNRCSNLFCCPCRVAIHFSASQYSNMNIRRRTEPHIRKVWSAEITDRQKCFVSFRFRFLHSLLVRSKLFCCFFSSFFFVRFYFSDIFETSLCVVCLVCIYLFSVVFFFVLFFSLLGKPNVNTRCCNETSCHKPTKYSFLSFLLLIGRNRKRSVSDSDAKTGTEKSFERKDAKKFIVYINI